jgi:hypothetical protein
LEKNVPDVSEFKDAVEQAKGIHGDDFLFGDRVSRVILCARAEQPKSAADKLAIPDRAVVLPEAHVRPLLKFFAVLAVFAVELLANRKDALRPPRISIFMRHLCARRMASCLEIGVRVGRPLF